MNDYYYAIGRIRTLESRLLTDVQIARLATATDLEACFGILSETSYNENLAKLTSKNPEELFSLEMVNLKDLL
ncbi:MAG: V-type ATPase subunit, partial [Candidatus Saganbacteria bacterium]|nr:V-type ATPase subunit [Candidatus Saganbacteria bacterium]